MKKLIASIFEDNEFKIIVPEFLQNQEGFFAVSTNNNRATYFIILFKEETVLLEELTNEFDTYFRELKRLEDGYDRRMDKNVSLLLCLHHNGEAINENLNHLIFEIEEDPYHFKKLVLPYTTAEVDTLKADIAVGNELYSILNDRKEFYEFKNDPFKESKYSLVAKLFIKLPFLHFSNFNEDIERLAEEIENVLNDKRLLEVRNDILQFINEINEMELVDEERIKKTLIWAMGESYE
ncbi:hypothetical protein LWE69_07145 [Paenibacillus sp. UKAQ_18]|nr:hypothetical protein [Paenibacillus sp. UKAQ_18]